MTNDNSQGNHTQVPPPPGGHRLYVKPELSHLSPPIFQSPIPIVNEISAGGLIVTHQGDDLVAAIIARRNRSGRLEWCLPKGHLEGTETPQEAAMREIREETGITGIISSFLGTVNYWFSSPERKVHKVVHHFLLNAQSGTITTEDDPDQEAEEAAWIRVSDLEDILAYHNERRMVQVAIKLLEESTQ